MLPYDNNKHSKVLLCLTDTPVYIYILYMKTNINIWSYLAQFFVEWEMFQKEILEKIKTNCAQQLFFPP